MTTQNNNEHLSGESNSRENFENKYNWPEDAIKSFLKTKEGKKIVKESKAIFEKDLKEFYKEQLKERE